MRALCDGLGIPRALAGLAPTPAEDVEERDTDRRSFLTGSMGAALVGAAAPLRDANAAHIGAAEVQQLHKAARELQVLDRLHGADTLCEIAIRCLRRADEWLNHATYASEIGRELQVAYGRLAQVTGWLHYDAGRQATARHHYREALGAAQLARDLDMEVWVLEAMSQQASYVGRPREAAQLARRAQEVAAGWATPRVNALLFVREATAWARAGDNAAFHRAFIEAEHVFDPRPEADDPHWIVFFDESELTGLKAASLSYLRHHDRAVALLAEAVRRKATSGLRRNHLWYQVRFAEEWLKLGDLTVGCEAIERALPALQNITSARIRGRLRDACRVLASRDGRRARDVLDQARRVGVATL
ncbi:MAG: hypothetical protein GEU94_07190 [Micromonosporaceae bacterium]|nr:hypothetical protein [Micromonosporaceae bacterium]